MYCTVEFSNAVKIMFVLILMGLFLDMAVRVECLKKTSSNLLNKLSGGAIVSVCMCVFLLWSQV